MAQDPEIVKSALQMLAESEGREFVPAPKPQEPQQPALQPLDAYSAQFGQAAPVQPSTMSYPEQMQNVWETVRPTSQGVQDAAAIAASGIYGTPMDIVGLLGGAREVLKGRIPSHEEMSLPGGSAYLEERAKQKGTLSQDPSIGATSAGILGSIFADPMAAAGKFGTLAMATMPAKAAGVAEKTAPAVEKALAYTRELTPLGLYSHAADTAAAMPQTMPAQQALNWLKGKSGIRNEELMAAGITDAKGNATPEFLERGKLTGPEFAKMINEGDFPQITETILGGDKGRSFTVTDFKTGEVVGSYPTAEEASSAAFRLNMGGSEAGAKYSWGESFAEGYNKPFYGPDTYPEASTPGGTNYREVLLRTPEKEYQPKVEYGIRLPDMNWLLLGERQFNSEAEAAAKVWDMIEKFSTPEARASFGDNVVDKALDSLNNAEVYSNKVYDPNSPNPNYVSGHFRDYTNTAAHIRMQDFSDPRSNSKILRVEEIQSDWAQGGRQRGWRLTEDEKQALVVEREMAAQKFSRAEADLENTYSRLQGDIDHPDYKAAYNNYAQAESELDTARNRARVVDNQNLAHPRERYVEDTKDWAALALKRVLKEAADNPEYGKLQVSAGDVQAARWAGSEDAEGVAKFYDTTIKSQLEKQVKKLDPDAKITKRKVERDINEDFEVENTLQRGEELNTAKRDVEDQMSFEEFGSEKYNELEYQLAEIEYEIEANNDKYYNLTKPITFFEVEITPKMREAIAKGLPRFKRGGKVGAHSESIVNKALMLSSKTG